MAKQAYLECGKIINTHGFRGEVKLEAWCDSPSVLAGLRRVFFREATGYREVKLVHASVFRQFVIAALDGVNDESAAVRLKGTVVYAAREDFHLKDGTYFIADLEGLPVIHERSGEILGQIREVINRGASDIYVIDMPDGRETMMPAVPEFVRRVDLSCGVYVTPIGGMFDDDETV